MEDVRQTSFFRFEDLRIYAKAMDYSRWLLNAMDTVSTEAQKSVFRPWVRASYDIMLNITEGASRSKSQFDSFLKNAKSAIRDCVVYTTLAANMGFIDAEQEEYSRTQLMELTRMIGALILSLQRAAQQRQEEYAETTIDQVDTNINTTFPEISTEI